MFFLVLRCFLLLFIFFQGKIFCPDIALDRENMQLVVYSSLDVILARIEGAQTYLDALGLPDDASEDLAKTAYKNLALRIHPDKVYNSNKTRCENAFKKLALLKKSQRFSRTGGPQASDNEAEALVESYDYFFEDYQTTYLSKWNEFIGLFTYFFKKHNFDECSKLLSKIFDLDNERLNFLEKHLKFSRDADPSEVMKVIKPKVLELKKALSCLKSQLKENRRKGQEDVVLNSSIESCEMLIMMFKMLDPFFLPQQRKILEVIINPAFLIAVPVVSFLVTLLLSIAIFKIPGAISMAWQKRNYLKQNKHRKGCREDGPEMFMNGYSTIAHIFETSLKDSCIFFLEANKALTLSKNKKNAEELLNSVEKVILECEKVFGELGFSVTKTPGLINFVLDREILKLEDALKYVNSLSQEKQKNENICYDEFTQKCKSLIASLRNLKALYPAMVLTKKHLKSSLNPFFLIGVGAASCFIISKLFFKG